MDGSVRVELRPQQSNGLNRFKGNSLICAEYLFRAMCLLFDFIPATIFTFLDDIQKKKNDDVICLLYNIYINIAHLFLVGAVGLKYNRFPRDGLRQERRVQSHRDLQTTGGRQTN